MKASSFFSREQQAIILNAVRAAEKNTSGEIRVHIESECSVDVLDRAAWVFNRLGMFKTEQRNGVLFYLAVNDRKFAIIGDVGINSKVPEGFWDEIKDVLKKNFVEGRFTDGLSEGIKMAGMQLLAHFPYQRDDVNEITDDISFDNLKGE